MTPWTLKLLGDCALLSPGGQPIRLSTRKSLALLAYVALQPERRARRQRLSALLWDDADAEQGRLHVRKALWLLRSESARAAPGAPPPIEGEGEWLAVRPGALVTDLDALLAASAGAGSDPAALEAAAALYPGDFLGDFSVRNAPAFEDWAEVERQSVREASVGLHRRLLDALATQPESGEAAMRAALRLIAIDPLQEHAHRAVMRLHVRQGRAAAALSHYRGLRETLRRDLAVEPEPETRALFADISAARRAGERAPEPLPEASAAIAPAPAPVAAAIPQAAPAPPRAPRRLLHALAGIAAAAVASFGIVRLAAPPAAAAPSVERIFPIPSGLVVSGRPALSPDGSRIAFTARARDGENVDLYLFTIGDAEPLRLTGHADVDDNAAWSPDGTRIAFTRASRDGSAPCRIFVMTVPGGTEHPAGACREARSTRLAWLPDGSGLLLSDRAAPAAPLALHVLTVADGRIGPVTSPPAELPGDREPVVSSDGRTVAFLRATAQDSADIFLLDLASKEVRRLTSDSGAIGGLAWSGGDGGLLFSSDRGGDAGLWWIARSGGSPERVSEGLLRYRALSQARSRNRIVFEGVRDRSALIDAGPGTALEGLSAGEAEFRDWFPDVAADGTMLFVSTRNGGEQIWTGAPGGGRPRQLTQLEGWRIVQPRWSPDGRHIAFAAVHGDMADLYLIGRGGGRPVRLTQDAAEDGSPEWSPDGRFLYFTSRRSGRPAIWRLAPFAADRTAVRVTPDGPIHARIDAAGRNLYYVYRGRPGLFRRALAPGGAAVTGPEEKVLASLAAADWANWALSGTALWWIERPAGVNRGARLKRRGLLSGAVHDVADASTLHRRSGFALAPDGHPVLNVQRLKVELYGIDFAEGLSRR